MSTRNSVSPKVVAAAAGAGAGAIVTALLLWGIGCVFYNVAPDAASVNDAIAAVPTPISGFVGLILAVLGAAIPGYQTTDPQRNPETNGDVVAFQTPAGLVVAGEASLVATGTPVDVEANGEVGAPGEDFVHDDL